jgi:PhzF family phenazine biosynthesis protein
MQIPIYQVDAFTSRAFGGNPAAVCPLDEWLPDATMQSIGNENNLSETAFLVPNGDRYHLRWFTPEFEIDLCGHATLASAFVVFTHLRPDLQQVAFDTRSGELVVKREAAGLLSMDFPSRPPQQGDSDPRLAQALGGNVKSILLSRDYLAIYETEEEVRALKPDMNLLAQTDRMTIVTAPGREVDFVSRFFAPSAGIAEDPVTGSAHCTLIPYWADRLGKTKLRALQVSRRGGELWCELKGDRVTMAGHAIEFMRGSIQITL